MRFSRARYVTLCQQSLVTAAVLAVGVSAAGVKTLDIVPQPGSTVGARGAGGGPGQDALAEPRERPEKAEVDAAPVTPKVREIKVTGISARAQGAPADRESSHRKAPGSATPSPAPEPKRSGPENDQATPARRLVALTDPQPVRGYATVGVTWKHGVSYSEDQLAMQVRTETNGKWSGWMAAEYHDDHGPDGGSSEEEAKNERPGTDALVIGDVDRVQMRAETTDGVTPPDLKLAVIDPGIGKLTKQAPAIDTAKLAPGATDAKNASQTVPSGSGAVQDTVALSAMRIAPKPRIFSRAQWGANERMREQSPPDYGKVKTGFIHHTVNANSYSSAQVPSLLRGIYAYHTQSRGWRDIGYNYLVDRFGRIWEGRYGGVNRAVVGAHTLGYNEYSFAMSAIGNFDIARPPAAVLNAYARLFAWKLSRYNIRANNARVFVKNRYLRAINGHRDVGQTACPGRYLYAKLPSIRAAARRIQLNAQSGTPKPPTPKPPAPPPPPAPPAPVVFTSPTQKPRPARPQPSAISFPKARNLAGSLHPDLVLKLRSTGGIRVLPTGGVTGFSRAISTLGGWRAMNLVTAAGDVTGDGRGDVLGRSARTGITRVYRGDGAGHVKPAGTNATKRFKAANLVVTAGDWNRDGRKDLLMRTRTSGHLYLVPGTGYGRFGGPRLLSKSWGRFTSTAVAGDLNGDSRPDIVGVNRGNLVVVPSTPSGGLGARVRRGAVGSQYSTLVGGAGDLNGDAAGDVVARSASTGRLSILTGRMNGSFGPRLGAFTVTAGLKRLTSAQMTGPANPDVVAINSTGRRLVVIPSNGRTNTSGSLPTNLRVPGATQVLSAGDWNRDGKGDVITRQHSGTTLRLRPGKGNGTFGTGVLMSKGWGPIIRLSAVGDVTGDRFPDLLGRVRSGPMRIFPGNGKTSFRAPMIAPASLRTFNQIGAGRWRPSAMPGGAFLSSDGSFVPFTGSSGGSLPRYDWVIGPGDVDGNGVNDLVVRDKAGTLWLLPGTSKGYLSPRFLASGYAGYSLGG